MTTAEHEHTFPPSRGRRRVEVNVQRVAKLISIVARAFGQIRSGSGRLGTVLYCVETTDGWLIQQSVLPRHILQRGLRPRPQVLNHFGGRHSAEAATGAIVGAASEAGEESRSKQ